MNLHTLILTGGLILAVVSLPNAEGRSSRYYGRHHSRRYEEEEPATRQIQQEEAKPVEIEPAQSAEASEEKPQPRPARARKAPVLCNANTAAANLAKPDKVETANPSDSGDEDSWEVIEPTGAESLEVKPLSPTETSTPAKAKKLEKPRGKVVPASEESSESVEEEEDEPEDDNFSAALASLEEPAAPKALTNDEIPEEPRAQVESQEEQRPKARRSKHHRHDVRRIERPHRRRVVFRDEEDD